MRWANYESLHYNCNYTKLALKKKREKGAGEKTKDLGNEREREDQKRISFRLSIKQIKGNLNTVINK